MAVSKSLHIGSMVTNVMLLVSFVGVVWGVDARYVHSEKLPDEVIKVADNKYVAQEQFENFHKDYLEGQIRELRSELREAERAEDPQWIDDVLGDLEPLLDEYCSQYPNSRYCD